MRCGVCISGFGLNVAAQLNNWGVFNAFFFLIQAGTKKMTGSNNAFFLGGVFFWGVLHLCANGQS